MVNLCDLQCEVISYNPKDKPLDELLSKEWLITNQRGGYSSSTIIGCNTRRYHSLLVGSLNPPVNRIVSLSNCLETINTGGMQLDFSTFEFDGSVNPNGYRCLRQFRKDVGVHFDYQIGDIELTKSVFLLQDIDTAVIVYNFTKTSNAFEFSVRPLVGLRDFHSLQKSSASLYSFEDEKGVIVRHDVPGSCELFLMCPSMEFIKEGQWWHNFYYRVEKERGQDFREDLWSPGYYKTIVASPCKIVLQANLSNQYDYKIFIDSNPESIYDSLCRHAGIINSSADTNDRPLRLLFQAADQFVTKRTVDENPHAATILAGYPWFADWGRDAFISLPGLLLETGRYEEAKSVLTTFANVANGGIIPNRFDDYTKSVHYNSVDASLWFINAGFKYLQASKDAKTFKEILLPAIDSIINAYYNGTCFNIHADQDSLITSGSEQTQLTWMDAKCGNITFTPRQGKAVEINALWYNALCLLAEYYSQDDVEEAKRFKTLGEKVKKSFCSLFWNDTLKYLNDCILPTGQIDITLRPNQIFAVSLTYSPLTKIQQKAVVKTLEQNLLTPYGLRTLPQSDLRYKGAYCGQQFERDAAYHQGTVWAFLMGAFIEAYLKVNNFSLPSRKKASKFIQPLLTHLTDEGCLGQVSEIFDGNAPYNPKGCFAQAWSIAELIRAYLLIKADINTSAPQSKTKAKARSKS